MSKTKYDIYGGTTPRSAHSAAPAGLTQSSMRIVPFRQNNECVYAVISDRAYRSVVSETTEHGVNETGGILLGHFLNGIWYIVEAVDPGINTVNRHSYFEYDGKYVNHLCSKLSRIYNYPLTILGIWHRHPGSYDVFSPTDLASMANITNDARVGILSMLVNVDPRLRMTFYYCNKRGEIMKIPCDVGDAYFPDEIIGYAEPDTICERTEPGVRVRRERYCSHEEIRGINSRYFQSAHSEEPEVASSHSHDITAEKTEIPLDEREGGSPEPPPPREYTRRAEWQVAQGQEWSASLVSPKLFVPERYAYFSDKAWDSMTSASISVGSGGVLLGHINATTASVVECEPYRKDILPFEEEYNLRSICDMYRKPLSVIGCWYVSDDCERLNEDDIDTIDQLAADNTQVLLVKVSLRQGMKVCGYIADHNHRIIRTHERIGSKYISSDYLRTALAKRRLYPTLSGNRARGGYRIAMGAMLNPFFVRSARSEGEPLRAESTAHCTHTDSDGQ